MKKQTSYPKLLPRSAIGNESGYKSCHSASIIDHDGKQHETRGIAIPTRAFGSIPSYLYLPNKCK